MVAICGEKKRAGERTGESTDIHPSRGERKGGLEVPTVGPRDRKGAARGGPNSKEKPTQSWHRTLCSWKKKKEKKKGEKRGGGIEVPMVNRGGGGGWAGSSASASRRGRGGSYGPPRCPPH